MKKLTFTTISLAILTVASTLSSQTQASTGTGTVEITVQPGTQTNVVAGSKSVDLMLDTNSAVIYGIDSYFDIVTPDSSSATAVNFTSTLAGSLEVFANTKTVEGNRAKISYSLATAVGQSYTNASPTKIGTITFSGAADQVFTIEFNSTSAAYDNTTYADILKTPTNATYTFAPAVANTPTATQVPTNTPTATAVPTATNTAVPTQQTSRDIDFTIGVASLLLAQNSNTDFNVKIDSAATTSLPFTSDGAGHFSTTLSDINDGGHKICVTRTTLLQKCYQITVSSSATSFDFANINDALPNGNVDNRDLASTNNNPTINLYDLSVILENYGGDDGTQLVTDIANIPDDPTTPEYNESLVDINLDNVLDINDFAIAYTSYLKQAEN